MAMTSAPPRALITAAAAELLHDLQRRHGPVMFHQSGGCCDGSSPMCYPDGEFIVGDRDVLLGILEGAPVWISGSQFETWKHTHLVIDVVPGRGGMFSLDGVHPTSLGYAIIANRILEEMNDSWDFDIMPVNLYPYLGDTEGMGVVVD